MRKWLKDLRVKKGLTQQSVAERSNIERAYYTMIEAGDRNPSVHVAKSIALVMGFDWTIFFDTKCNEVKQNNVG
ncbi:transcriptional regulator [Sporosarcina sp. P2]|uniref:helix-turn-helix transcriptional regulator n=1 Tax=Sporosarcina sp. P2 TaxID=2048251 RepID=UPI000C16ADCB|nr:helix-turn-helix transcriptional regulator [Sporosarcina sp. P2]PID03645.1 transcriptional regulator [Sporosarcina sp. P2]